MYMIVSQAAEVVNKMLELFSGDPQNPVNAGLLAKALSAIKEIKRGDYIEWRFSLLMLHVKILREFDRYYIADYNPKEGTVLPPSDAFDEPVFFPVNPQDIKNKK